jgi:hypothetical protein
MVVVDAVTLQTRDKVAELDIELEPRSELWWFFSALISIIYMAANALNLEVSVELVIRDASSESQTLRGMEDDWPVVEILAHGLPAGDSTGDILGGMVSRCLRKTLSGQSYAPKKLKVFWKDEHNLSELGNILQFNRDKSGNPVGFDLIKCLREIHSKERLELGIFKNQVPKKHQEGGSEATRKSSSA